jgi:hypothetical protein
MALSDTKMEEGWKVNKGVILTVSISKHDAGALPPELQGDSLQIAFTRRFFDYFANLKASVAKEEA